MYSIIKMLNGTFQCVGSLQDGTERWFAETEVIAVQSMITFARIGNNSYITRNNIYFCNEEPPPPPPPPSAAEAKLLEDIRVGRVVTVSHDDSRIRYGITDEECELIIKIREGDVVAIPQKGVSARTQHGFANLPSMS